MVKSKRKIRKSAIISLLILLIVIPLSTYFTINNYSKIQKQNKETNKLKLELKEKKKEYNEISKSKDEIANQINELSNLDSKIESTKNEVFKLASEVEQKILNKETSYKIAYLTFDDGPYYQTDNVLKTLKENKVKATFFTIGAGKEKCFDKKSVSCMETYKKIVDSGNTIANHTYSHSIFYGLYKSTDNFIEQVKKQEELILSKTNVKTNILRFPGGSVTAGRLKQSIIEELRKLGYGWVDWTAEDGDGRDLQSKEQAWSLLKSTIDEDIEVILMHDYDTITYSILPDLIKYLEEKDYILLPLFYDSVKINK